MSLYDLLWECVNIEYSEVGLSSNYAVRLDGDTLFIFFQGSEGVVDWLNNLDFWVDPIERNGDVSLFAHRGFLRVWMDILPSLVKYIFNNDTKKIIITGYSHGGAIAMLCYEYIWYYRPDIRDSIEGYGFASPRVFWGEKDNEFATRWENFTVIRNIDDIVTHMPPAILGYSHVGKLLEIAERGKYTPMDAHRVENILIELKIMETKQNST